MTFDSIAKDLLKKTEPTINQGLNKDSNKLNRAATISALAASGFSRDEVFSELKDLYDNTEDDSIKKQILDMIIKVHGLYKDDEVKEAPTFIFNITTNNDKSKMIDMLCPAPAPTEAAA